VTPVRVLFVNEGPLGPGAMGHPRVEEALRAGLGDRSDIDADFVSLKPMSWVGRLLVSGVPLLSRVDADFQQQRWHLTQAARARRFIRREVARARPDVVHVHSHSIALGIDTTLRRIPAVLSVDATVHEWQTMSVWRAPREHTGGMVRLSERLEHRVFADAAIVQAWTAWARDGVAASCPSANIVELHPGINLDDFHPAPRVERRRPRVLFVGGRFKQKGGFDLLDALGPDLGRTVDLDVVTPSDVPSRPGVTIHRLPPGDDRLRGLFQQADVLCLPTRGDAVPWVVIEAMACGTPVVATDVGGIADLLDGGRAGILTPPRDVDALRTALRSLLADDAHRDALATVARRRVEEHYDARLQTDKLLKAFASVGLT